MSTVGPSITEKDAGLLIGLTAAVEALIRADRIEEDEAAVISRHVARDGRDVSDVLAELNHRLRLSLDAYLSDREPLRPDDATE